MMGKFVRNGVCKAQQSLSGDPLFEDVEIIESYNSCVFHCSPFILMGKYLIIFVERKRVIEKLLEKLQGLDGDFKDEWS